MQTTDDNATDRDEETNHPLLIQSGKSCNPGDSPPRSVVSDQSHQYRSVMTSDFSFGIYYINEISNSVSGGTDHF